MFNERLKATTILGILWICLFLIDKQINLMDYFAGKGMNNLGNEYYRLITCPLLHFNLLHLVVNVIAILCVGHFLDHFPGNMKMTLFILIAGFITDIIYSYLYKNSTGFFGGSIYVFALFGLMLVLKIFRPNLSRFHLGTWEGNYLMYYGILGNIPILSFMDFSTAVIHIIAFITGSFLAVMGILFGVI